VADAHNKLYKFKNRSQQAHSKAKRYYQQGIMLLLLLNFEELNPLSMAIATYPAYPSSLSSF